MQNYPIRKIRKILKQNNYTYIRTKGSHEIYSNGKNTVSITYPITNALVARKIIKNNNLIEEVK